MTKVCGKVIAAKNEKNRALKISLSLNKTYKSKMPSKEKSQYTKAALK
jgi:hypothetical protein